MGTKGIEAALEQRLVVDLIFQGTPQVLTNPGVGSIDRLTDALSVLLKLFFEILDLDVVVFLGLQRLEELQIFLQLLREKFIHNLRIALKC